MTATKTKKIKLLVKENPKRGKSAARYALYKDGMTTTAYAEAVRKALAKTPQAKKAAAYARADLIWDADPKRGHIELV